MFGKGNQPVTSGKIDTIIGNGSNFDGNLNVEGTLRIDGNVEGQIQINGDVIVGKTGSVRANIKGRNVTVAGEVHGDIFLDGKLEMSSTGKVIGNIEVAKLVINEGALFKGNSVMQGNDRVEEITAFTKKDEHNKDERNKENKTSKVHAEEKIAFLNKDERNKENKTSKVQ